MFDKVIKIENKTFVVKGGKLMITDPCYDRKTWCQGIIDNVKDGHWLAEVRTFDTGTISELMAYHNEWGGEEPSFDTGIDVGVDSGQAGIFNESSYPHGETDKARGKEESFYGRACEATLGDCLFKYKDPACDIITEGVVSLSGHGDGSYKAYTTTENGMVTAVKISFFGEDKNGFEDIEMSEEDYNAWD